MPMQKKKSGKSGGRKRQGATRLQPKPEAEETPESVEAKALELELQQHADLMDAARRGSLGKLRELISVGANLEAQDKRGETAFHVCCYKGHLECVKALAAAGCSLDVLDTSGCTGLMSAANSGRLDILVYLLEQGGDMERISLHGHTAFMLAYLNGHADCVRLLVQKGCNTSSKTKALTGLMEAAMGGRTAVVWAMLEGGVERDAVDKDGRTAFHWACAKNHPDCAEALFRSGSDTTIESNQGHTGIHIAQRLGHTEVVNRMRELVAHKLADATELAGKTITGDDIDWSQRGYTAFHLACAGGQVEHVEAMFRAGIDTTCVTTTKDNFAGETGYDVAKRLGHTAVVQRLEELQAEAAKQAKKERDNRRKKEQKKRKKLQEQQRKLLETGASVPALEGGASPGAGASVVAGPTADVTGAGDSPQDLDDPVAEVEIDQEPEPEPEPEPKSGQEHGAAAAAAAAAAALEVETEILMAKELYNLLEPRRKQRDPVPDDAALEVELDIEEAPLTPRLDIEEAPIHPSCAMRNGNGGGGEKLLGGLTLKQVDSIVAPLRSKPM